jgi:hypothetical protein
VFQLAGRPQSSASAAFLHVWYTGAGNIASFRGDGAFFVGNLPATTTHTLCASSGSGGGYIGRCSSSRRYKKDIEDLKLGMDVVSRLRPVTFTSTISGERDLGFVAEEVAQIDPLLAINDADGRPESVRYIQLTAVLAKAVQTQEATIRSQAVALRAEESARLEQARLLASVQADVAKDAAALKALGTVVDDQRRLIERQAAVIERLEQRLVAAKGL